MQVCSGYHIIEQLYEGAHSIVYRGRRATDARPGVLKILKGEYPSPKTIAQFRREYGITRSLAGEGVIDAYALESYKNTLVMVLEDFGGESLTRLFPQRPLTLRSFLRLAIRIIDILGAIHQQHVIHKDINPSNIVWNPTTDQLKIIDFGLSTTLSQEQPDIRSPNVLEGTLAYMSPEQTGRMNRTIDYRTDLYSLGATLYHLLTGTLPFEADDAMALIHCHLAKLPVPPHELTLPLDDQAHGLPLRAVSDIIMKLLSKNAEDRYQSIYGLHADLAQCLAHLTDSGKLAGFTPGHKDVVDRFRIPQTLYGRERERDILLQAFQQVQATGHSSLLLVAGYAGLGKSSLVYEIRKPVTVQHGYFITGKFDRFMRDTPHFAIIQAFQGFVRQLLTEPPPRLIYWQQRLFDALGPNGQVIIDVIPDVELIMGKQPAIPDLPPTQAQHRFNFALHNFVRTFAAADHPLVMFLDDLQWADFSSLALLRRFLADGRMKHMLIVGAYRDNDVNNSHPLMLMLDALQRDGATVRTIRLKPLELVHVDHLITDTLQTPTAPPHQASLPLADLSLQKTGGNPFFLRQFLHALHKERFLEFDQEARQWTWKPEAIRKAAITDNVVEFMANNIQKLSDSTQQVVKLAACIGNQFDLPTLSIVYEHSQADTLQALWNALEEDMVIPLNDAYKYVGEEIGRRMPDTEKSESASPVSSFKFHHDRIQQAAYSLIDDRRKRAMHLKIGRLLCDNISKVERDERIFDIVNHLNLGKDFINTQAEKDDAAELNLLAGQKAKTSAAYQTALAYFQKGLALLGPEGWQRQYDLTLTLSVEAAEAAYLSGEFETMEPLAGAVLRHAGTLLDKVKVYEVMIEACKAQNKLLEAVKTGLTVLKLLGVSLPEYPNTWHLARALTTTKLALAGKSIENLINLPEMTNPSTLAAMRILSKVGSAAYYAVPNLLPLIIFKAVILSVKYGNTPISAHIYAGYGLILCGVVGDIDAGYRFGTLALKVLEHFKTGEFRARTIFFVNTFIRHWKDPAQETLPALQETYYVGLETGDLEYAAFSALIYANYAYFTGRELSGLEREIAVFDEAMGQLKQETARNHLRIYWQAVLNLRKEPAGTSSLRNPSTLPNTDSTSSQDLPPWHLMGDAYNEEQMLPLHLQANDRSVLFGLSADKLFLCYVFQAYPQAVENANTAELYIDGVLGMLDVSRFHFYDSLARLAAIPDGDPSGRKRIFRKVAANQKKMKKWARYAPANVCPRGTNKFKPHYLKKIRHYSWRIRIMRWMRILEKSCLLQRYTRSIFPTIPCLPRFIITAKFGAVSRGQLIKRGRIGFLKTLRKPLEKRLKIADLARFWMKANAQRPRSR